MRQTYRRISFCAFHVMRTILRPNADIDYWMLHAALDLPGIRPSMQGCTGQPRLQQVDFSQELLVYCVVYTAA